MDLLPDHSLELARQERSSEEIAELYKQSQHVAMLRLPYDLPSGESFSPFMKNRFGNLTRHLIAHRSRWMGSFILSFILFALPLAIIANNVLRDDPSIFISFPFVIASLFALVLFSVSFAHLIFFAALLLEFAPSYGLGALKAIKAPTAICLAPLSIKFLWLQGFGAFRARVHGTERTVGWEEIIGVDRHDGADSLPLIVITARVMHRDEVFPVHLAGLANKADRLAFLRALDLHIQSEKKTPGFIELLSAPELPQLLLSAPSRAVEETDPIAQIFMTKDETSTVSPSQKIQLTPESDGV